MLWLLIGVGSLLILYPYMETTVGLAASMRVFGIVVPVVGVIAVSRSRRQGVPAVVLAVPTVVGAIDSAVGVDLVPQPLGAVSALVFYLFTTIVILTCVVRRGRVGSETIYAALTAYLMLGLTWTMAYIVTEFFVPGSFNLPEDRSPGGTDLLYFSYVTLTTLGYGDITPSSTPAQSLAFTEALTGVLYIAVLISRLVGAWSRESESSGSSDHGE